MKAKRLLAVILTLSLCMQGMCSVLAGEEIYEVNDGNHSIKVQDMSSKVVIDCDADKIIAPVPADVTFLIPAAVEVINSEVVVNANIGREHIENDTTDLSLPSGGNESALLATDSKVTVNGDVKTCVVNVWEYDGMGSWDDIITDYGNAGIITAGSEIHVTGDVVSDLEGIVSNSSKVLVDGDVKSKYPDPVNIWNKDNLNTDPETGKKYVAKLENKDGRYSTLESLSAPAIKATNVSEVRVGGNVTNVKGDAIVADSSLVAVQGNVQDLDETKCAITANDYATVTVGGTVTAQGDAIKAADEAIVHVTGSVTSAKENAITASKGAVVTASGVLAEKDAINVVDSTVKVDNAVISKEGTAITAKNGSKVTAGSVQAETTTGYGVFVSAGDKDTTVDVQNNVYSYNKGISAGGSTAYAKVTAQDVTSVKDTAIFAGSHADVQVRNVESTSGTAIEAYQGANVTANNVTSHKEDGINASTQSTVSVNSVDAAKTGVKAAASSTIQVTQYVTAKDTAIDAADSAVTVGGNVKSEEGTGVSASGASVNVAGSITAKEDGIVASGKGAVVTAAGKIVSSDGNGAVLGKEAVAIVSDVEAKKDGIQLDQATALVSGAIDAADNGVVAKNGSNAIIAKEVEAGKNGIVASGTDTKVIAGDYVSANNNGVDVSDKAVVELIEGVESVYGDAIHAASGAAVTSGGNVASDYANGINAQDSGTKVTVDGDVTGNAAGIKVDEKAKVDVDGNVTAYKAGVLVEIDGTTAEGCVFISGELYADQDAFVIQDSTNSLDASAFLAEIPEIIVYEAANGVTGKYVSVNGNFTETEEDEIAEQIAKEKIEYIIKSNAEHGTITLTTATYNTEHGVYVANEGDITISIVPDAGYEVKSVTGNKAIVTLLSDGTYQVTIPRGGGVDIFALCELIAEHHEDPKPVITPIPDHNGGNGTNGGNGSNSGNGTNSGTKTENGTVVFEIPLNNNQKDASEGEFICVADAQDKNEGVEQVKAEERLEGLSDEQIKAVKAVDAKNIELTNLETAGYVYGESIRVNVEDAPKTVTLYANRDYIEKASVLFLDVEKDEWSEIETTIDPDTGLIDFEVSAGDGIVALLIK